MKKDKTGNLYEQSLRLIDGYLLTLIEPEAIPDKLLDAWLTVEPVTGKPRRRKRTLPYRVFLHAYDLHGRLCRREPLRHDHKVRDFVRFQYLLQVIRASRVYGIACPRLMVFAFYQYDYTISQAERFAFRYFPDFKFSGG